jgi:hypothetical protein
MLITKQEKFTTAVIGNDIDTARSLINDPNINPTESYNIFCVNYPILLAHSKKNTLMVELLWTDKRVRVALKEHNSYLFNKLSKLNVKNKIKDF